MEKLQIPKELPLMSAKKIELRVLAPGEFFTDHKRNAKMDLDLEWFEKSLNSGLKQFCDAHEATIEMDFKFLKFGRGFTWPMTELGASNEQALLEWLRQEINRIEPVYGRSAQLPTR